MKNRQKEIILVWHTTEKMNLTTIFFKSCRETKKLISKNQRKNFLSAICHLVFCHSFDIRQHLFVTPIILFFILHFFVFLLRYLLSSLQENFNDTTSRYVTYNNNVFCLDSWNYLLLALYSILVFVDNDTACIWLTFGISFKYLLLIIVIITCIPLITYKNRYILSSKTVQLDLFPGRGRLKLFHGDFFLHATSAFPPSRVDLSEHDFLAALELIIFLFLSLSFVPFLSPVRLSTCR